MTAIRPYILADLTGASDLEKVVSHNGHVLLDVMKRTKALEETVSQLSKSGPSKLVVIGAVAAGVYVGYRLARPRTNNSGV